MNETEPTPNPLNIERLFNRDPQIDDNGQRQDIALIQETPSSLGVRGRAGGYYAVWRQAGPNGQLRTTNESRLYYVFMEVLPSSVLVELGGGAGNLARVLRSTIDGARVPILHYVNIDINASSDQRTSKGVAYSVRGSDAKIRADVLDALQRLPDYNDPENQVGAIAIHGLEVSEDKARAIAKEIIRVIRPGGLVFGIEDSKILQYIIEDEEHGKNFETLLKSRDYPAVLRRKKEEN